MNRSLLVALGLLTVVAGCTRPTSRPGHTFDVNAPMTRTDVTLSSADGTKLPFTLDVPQGLVAKPDGNTSMLDFEDPANSFVSPVSIHLFMTGGPSTLKQAVSYLSISPGTKILEQKELNPSDPIPDWTAVSSSNTGFTAKSMHRTGKAGLECTARYIGDQLQEPAKMQAMLSRICSSVKPSVPAMTGEQAAAEKAGPLAPEATAFFAMFNGKSAGVAAALKKFGAKGLATHDMADYGLADPKVVKTSHVGTMTCNDMTASSGVTKRGYTVCFDKGKVQKITPLGSNGLLPPGS